MSGWAARAAAPAAQRIRRNKVEAAFEARVSQTSTISPGKETEQRRNQLGDEVTELNRHRPTDPRRRGGREPRAKRARAEREPREERAGEHVERAKRARPAEADRAHHAEIVRRVGHVLDVRRSEDLRKDHADEQRGAIRARVGRRVRLRFYPRMLVTHLRRGRGVRARRRGRDHHNPTFLRCRA